MKKIVLISSTLLMAACQGIPPTDYSPTIDGSLPAKVRVGTVSIAPDAQGRQWLLNYEQQVFEAALPAEFGNMDALDDTSRCTLNGQLRAFDSRRISLGTEEQTTGTTFTLQNAADQTLFEKTFETKKGIAVFADTEPQSVTVHPVTETIRKLVRDQGFLKSLSAHCR